jgi:hypothetical protein
MLAVTNAVLLRIPPFLGHQPRALLTWSQASLRSVEDHSRSGGSFRTTMYVMIFDAWADERRYLHSGSASAGSKLGPNHWRTSVHDISATTLAMMSRITCPPATAPSRRSTHVLDPNTLDCAQQLQRSLPL